MKNYFFTILLLCTGILCLSQNRTTTATTSFNGFHCDGTPGLCAIDMEQNRAISNSSITIYDTMLIMEIEREKLSDKEIKNLFKVNPQIINNSKKYYFKLDNPFVLQASLCEILDTGKSNIAISSGTYLIKITKEFFTITFNIH